MSAAAVWYTNSFVSLFMDGLHIAIDPINTQTFKTWLNMKPGWPRPCQGQPDLVAISHGHYDHFDPAYLNELHHRRAFRLLLPRGIGGAARLDRHVQPRPVAAGDCLDVGSVHVEAFPCLHRMEKPFRAGNVPCLGYVFRAGVTVCFIADTVYQDFRPFLGIGKIDLLLLTAGGRTILSLFKTHLDDEDSLRIIGDVQPRAVVPVHWNSRRTVPWLLPERNDIATLKRRAEDAYGVRFDILAPGERREF